MRHLAAWIGLGRLTLFDRGGVAATELALVAGIIVTILVGMFDLGLWLWQRMQLQEALNAGIHYAQQFPSDTAGIQSATTVALGSAVRTATVAPPAIIYDCGSADSTTSTIPWCEGQRTWITVSASMPFTPLYLTAIGSIQVSYAIRIQ